MKGRADVEHHGVGQSLGDGAVPLVRLADARVDYPDARGTVCALDGVTYDFPFGSATAVVGRSGSGKSTLVTVLALLRRPSAGEVVFDGVPTSALRDAARARLRRRIGMVFQGFHVDDRNTVLGNTLFANTWLPRTARSASRSRAMELLDLLGIADLAHRKAVTLSGGQRQRVAIARALCGRPALLLADEPTGNLDEATAEHVAGDLYEIARQTRTTLIVVTHDAAVAALAQRRVLIQSGRVHRTW